jgi:predicted enzyme related to lactoylglutathione lyase
MEYTVSDIGQIAITVSNVDAALHFYSDILGLPTLFRPAPTLAFVAAGSVRIMLTTPQGAGAVGENSLLFFKVRNIEETYAAVAGRGATTEREPVLTARMPDHELWIAHVRDPDGNLVALMEEKR